MSAQTYETPTSEPHARRLSVVPTERTRAVARAMITAAQETAGADAAMQHLWKVHPTQIPALIGVLLTNAKLNAKIGRPRLPDEFTEEERLRANRQYKAGERDEWTVAGWREYQRIHQRMRTERVGRFGR